MIIFAPQKQDICFWCSSTSPNKLFFGLNLFLKRFDVSILVFLDGFCNYCPLHAHGPPHSPYVSILVFVDGFCNDIMKQTATKRTNSVSILVFVDGFCNYYKELEGRR